MLTVLLGCLLGLGYIAFLASFLSWIDGEGFNPRWLWRG